MMKTEVICVDSLMPESDLIQRAANLLREGKLVAFPTETVYGLGANALEEKAVAKIFEAKGRPASNPLIVHVASIPEAQALAEEWPEKAQLLAKAFWPGSLTLVVPRSKLIPDIVTAGGPTVALRIPAHPVALALITAAALPLAAPSANRSNRLSPTTAQHVWQDLNGLVEMILDAGPAWGGLESTVLDVTGDPPRLLRPGLITITQLESVVGTVVRPHLKLDQEEDKIRRSPGMFKKHYAPRTPLECVPADQGEQHVRNLLNQGLRVGWITFQPPRNDSHTRQITLILPVFRIDDQASCRIIIKNSLFSRPLAINTPNKVTQDLLHQTGSADGRVKYSGTDNRYHNLNFYWVRSKSESMPNTLADFKNELKDLFNTNDDSMELESQNNPFRLANPLLTLGDDPKSAFQLDNNIPELRPVNGKTIGVQKCVWGNTYEPGYWSIQKAPTPPVVVSTTEFIVDPELKGSIQGHYRTLSAAIEEAPRDGITILLKHNGQMPVTGVRLNQSGKKIILKPHPGYRPELTLQSDGSDPDAALFEIQWGQIVFEGLSILLEPDRKGFHSQSVVELSNQGHCVFDNCVLTLKPSAMSKKTYLYGVSFTGANNVSPAEAKLTNPPRIELRDTLVRGEGIFLNFTKAGPYELDVNNSLVVLYGSMIKAPINHPIKSILPSPGKITLNKTTTYLSDHLLHLTDEGTGMGLITTTVVANDSLFAAYDSFPLLQFTGLNSAIKRDQLFQWSGFHNAYCGYDTILYQQPTQSGTPLEYKSTNWMMKENMQGDPSQVTRFVNDSFDFKLMEGKSQSEIIPADVTKMIANLQKQQGDKKEGASLTFYGANLAQLQLRLPLSVLNPVPAFSPPEELNTEEP